MNFAKKLKNTFFTEHLQTTASVGKKLICLSLFLNLIGTFRAMQKSYVYFPGEM